MIVEGDETQEATELMVEAILLPAVYLRKDECCKCAV